MRNRLPKLQIRKPPRGRLTTMRRFSQCITDTLEKQSPNFRPSLKKRKGKDTFLDATVTSPPYFDLKDYGSDDTNEVGQHGSYIEYLDELRAIFEHVYSITNEDGSLWVVVNTFRRNHELIQLPFDIARVCQNLEQGMECSNCENTVLRGVEVLDGPGTACPHCGGSISSEASWILQDIVVWNKNKALPYTKRGSSPKRLRVCAVL